MCVALLERRSAGSESDRRPEVAVVPTETVWANTVAESSGLLATDLPVGSGARDLHSVSLVVFGVERRPQTRDIVDSIESLGQVLDYDADADGSAAVGDAIVRRVDSLANTPGVTALVAGVVTPSTSLAGEDTHHVLVAPGLPAGADLQLDDDDRVVARAPTGTSDPWRQADFVLVGFGRSAPRQGGFRSLRELRLQHSLVDIGLEPGPVSAEEPWTARAARMRQTTAAHQVVTRVRADDTAGARAVLRSASGEPDTTAFVDGLAARISSPGDYWLIDAFLEGLPADAPSTEITTAARLRERLFDRLEELLGLHAPEPDPQDPTYVPVTRPIVVQVSDALVPFVDSRQDGGLFLEQLIPAMKKRIAAGTGVTVPGIRAQGNPNLPFGHFQVQIDEVPVLDGAVQLYRSYTVRPCPPPGTLAAGELTNVDPWTGDPGAWLLDVDGEAGTDEVGTDEQRRRLTTAPYLIHRIELMLRSHLVRFFGLQGAAVMFDDWVTRDGGELVAATASEPEARVRLTWLLQAVVDDGLPVDDLPAILRPVVSAGGLAEPLTRLRRVVRTALRDRLPGPRDAERCVAVEAAHEHALSAEVASEHLPPMDVVRWLRSTVDELGPIISLVTHSDLARERLAPLARIEHPFISTFTADEWRSAP
jgi:hypothetical protein